MVKRSTLTLLKAQRGRVEKAVTQHDVAAESRLKLPSERDESVVMTPAEPDPAIKQAAIDIERGLQDTSNGLETNRVYKKLK